MNELSTDLPAAGVVRVVGPEIAGAGFLVAEGLIVTCAHVLAGCTVGTTVGIEPHVDHRPLSAIVVLLKDPPDVAVLRLTAPVPPGAVPLRLGHSPKTSQAGLRTFGYPDRRPEAGLPGELAFYGVTADAGYDQLALRSEEATVGFSGAPIWDPEQGAVVGMIKSILTKDGSQRLGTTAIGVPVEVIRDICPMLRLPAERPYRGLDPFTEEHVDYYNGREHAISQLLTSLANGGFVAVVAVSGGGKSSLLQAGLAKGLRDRPVVGLAERIRCYQRVSGQPHAELLLSLAEHGLILPPELAEAPPQELAAAIRGVVPPGELIVVVDQFERLYTDCQDAERKRFIKLLLRLATDTVKVVIGLRADFYHLALDDLGERLATGQVALAKMTEQDLEQAITAPAEKLLRSFQPGLTQQLIADVRDRPGDLPLLQFALTELWERDAAGGVLTKETYRDLGVDLADGTHQPGVRGALIRRAEQLWQDLGPADQLRLRRILLGLIARPADPGTASSVADMRDLSRPARLAQWGEDDQRLIRRLTDARLLTTDRAPAGGQPTVEVSHEALLRAWPRLQELLEKHKEFVQWRARDLAPNLERWLDSKEGPEFLLPRPLLDPALQWLNDYPEELAGPPADYIQATKRRRVRRRRLLSGAVAILVGASLAAVVIFYSLQQAAVSQTYTAQSEEMASEAANLLPADGPLAMLLSLQAYERAPTLQAGSALIQAAQQPLDYLLASGSEVDSVVFSPGGRTLAAVSDDGGHVSLWDTATGRETATFTLAHGSTADSAAFSPDGRTLAVSDDSGHVSLWDTATGQKTATFTFTLADGFTADSVVFSPDGRTLATGDGYDIGLWDTATRRETATFTLADGIETYSAAFTPDGRTLAVRDSGGHVGMWNTATGRKTANLAGGNTFKSVAFSPDGRTLAVGDDGGYVGIWDTATGRKTATLTEGSIVYSVAFSPDGHTLAVGDASGHVAMWDTATGRKTATLAEGNTVDSVAFSPDGRTLAVGDQQGYIGIWDIATPRKLSSVTGGSRIHSVALSPDGRTLAVGDDRGHVSLWDTATGRKTATLTDGNTIWSVAFSPDGRTLAAGDAGDIGIWDVATGRKTATLAAGGTIMAFSPDGRTLAAGDAGGIGIWDMATGRETATLADGYNTVESVAFSPDGHSLAAGDQQGYIGIWDTATGRKTATLTERSPINAERSPIHSVAFSPDGRTLAVGDDAGDIGMWDVATGRKTATLADGSTVWSVAFSPGGPTFVTGDSLGNVSIWNAGNGQRFAGLAEGSAVGSLAFSSHGQVLAIAGQDGNIMLLWQNLANLSQRYFMQLICGKVQGNMSQAQWAEYVPGQPYQKTCP